MSASISPFLWTILLAALLMGCVVLGLGIGWLLTGKSHLRKRCGYTPDKKGTGGCSLCGKQPEKGNDRTPPCR